MTVQSRTNSRQLVKEVQFRVQFHSMQSTAVLFYDCKPTEHNGFCLFSGGVMCVFHPHVT